MEGYFLAPAVEGAPSHPTWVLLNRNPYEDDNGRTCFDDGDNATTAYAITSSGHTVKVTFRLASPPSVSRFCFHDAEYEGQEAYYDRVEAELISSAKDLVLFRLSSREQPDLYEYLVYQAACHRGNSLPTLKLIPTIHPGTSYPGILACDDDDDGEFLLADLSPTPNLGHYVLDVFSSKTNKWVTRRLQLQSPRSVCTEDLPPHNVITLGGGSLGWVDLWRGILVCNTVDGHPVLRFIPLPKPGIDLHPLVREHGDPQMIRDVTCCDGIITFIEIDCRFKRVPRTDIIGNKTMYDDLDGEGIIYDSELLLEKGDPSCPVEYDIAPDGWKIRKCYRHVSWDYWRKSPVVDSDDVQIDNTTYSMVKDYNTQRWTLKHLASVAYHPNPTLSACGDDIVYLWSAIAHIWMVGINLEKKMVEVVEEINIDNFQLPRLLSCAFSKM